MVQRLLFSVQDSTCIVNSGNKRIFIGKFLVRAKTECHMCVHVDPFCHQLIHCCIPALMPVLILPHFYLSCYRQFFIAVLEYWLNEFERWPCWKNQDILIQNSEYCSKFPSSCSFILGSPDHLDQ